MANHRHMSNVEIAAEALKRDGHISAFDAVYLGECDCGAPKRNTRLAATIHTLRHRYGWSIRTDTKEGMLADYVLDSHPVNRRQFAAASAPEPKADAEPSYWCPHCTQRVTDALGQHFLGGYRQGRCRVCEKEVMATTRRPDHGVDSTPTDYEKPVAGSKAGRA